ncbi:hypothetical protein GCM10010525_31310 [Glutamicibacter bergerei]|jgi:hypothetical protein|uniref:Secreted protein n=1 Tax=Glutamicibacter ardleyensis TaxID=225894 RepID=A0ABQ2DU81_9MICC|nr:hypothetical protein GCM10007173_27380 [Glutamicibacter ardleyensis]
MLLVAFLSDLAAATSAAEGKEVFDGAAATEIAVGNFADGAADAGTAPARHETARARVHAATPSEWRFAISFLTRFR